MNISEVQPGPGLMASASFTVNHITLGSALPGLLLSESIKKKNIP